MELNNKEIRSCDESVIERLIVEELRKKGKSFIIKLKRDNKGVNVINIQNPDTIFSITELPFSKVKNSDFKLNPLSKYKITNLSNGDIADFSIIISTDIKGEIVNSDKLTCSDIVP